MPSIEELRPGIADDSNDDDDGPPPLEDMSAVLGRLAVSSSDRDKQASGNGGLSGTSTSQGAAYTSNDSSSRTSRGVAGIPESNASSKAPAVSNKVDSSASTLKRGFFDAPKGKGRAKPKPEEESMPFLKGSVNKKKEIPEFLKVDMEETPVERAKRTMMDAMKPTPDLMKDVMSNKSVVTGFDDPEVMAAVAEVAKDPSAMQRHRHNPKVVQFYAEMGKLMGNRLQKQGEGQLTPS